MPSRRRPADETIRPNDGRCPIPSPMLGSTIWRSHITATRFGQRYRNLLRAAVTRPAIAHPVLLLHLGALIPVPVLPHLSQVFASMAYVS